MSPAKYERQAQMSQAQPTETDSMLNFDERDLIDLAEQAGFGEIHPELQAEIKRVPDLDWETASKHGRESENSDAAEAIQESLTPIEREEFIAYLRPLVEARQSNSFRDRAGVVGPSCSQLPRDEDSAH